MRSSAAVLPGPQRCINAYSFTRQHNSLQGGLVGLAESAAERRSREAPQEPQVESLPHETERGLALFNSVVLDKLLRESASRTR